METFIFTLLLAGWLWWINRDAQILAKKLNLASNDATFFIECILNQDNIDETIETFQFCIVTFSTWEDEIPHKAFKYHTTSIVEAYKYKIDQFTYKNLN